MKHKRILKTSENENLETKLRNLRTWGICIRRAGKRYRARSRMYRSRFLQKMFVGMMDLQWKGNGKKGHIRWKALAEIYTIQSVLQLFWTTVSISSQFCWNVDKCCQDVGKCCQDFAKFIKALLRFTKTLHKIEKLIRNFDRASAEFYRHSPNFAGIRRILPEIGRWQPGKSQRRASSQPPISAYFANNIRARPLSPRLETAEECALPGELSFPGARRLLDEERVVRIASLPSSVIQNCNETLASKRTDKSSQQQICRTSAWFEDESTLHVQLGYHVERYSW